MSFLKFSLVLFQLTYFTPDVHTISLIKRNDFVLDCISDNPDDARPERYVWTKNENAIHMPRKLYISEGTLVFETINEETEGTYQCYVENDLGVASSNTISVRAHPRMFAPELEARNVTVAVNAPLSLSCKLPKGWPERIVTWGQMDSTGVFYPLNNSRAIVDQNGNLYISNVEKGDESSDGTNYVCAVSSRLINEITVGCRTILRVNETKMFTTFPLTQQFVSPRKVLVEKNRNVTLYCIYGGVPAPKIEWRRGPQFLTRSSILTIKNVTEKDAGLYVCLVDHFRRTRYHTIFLEVLVPPSFIDEPLNERKVENSSVEIRCNASGSPEPNIQWTYNGQPIDEMPYNPRRVVNRVDNSLTIENSTSSDSGYYACNASNTIGYVFKEITVRVFERTRIQRNKGFVDQVATHGSSVRFHCEAKAGDAKCLSFLWKQNDVPLIDGSSTNFLIEYGHNFSSLTIVNASVTRPLSKYTCVAISPWDQDSADVLLIVKDRPSAPLITGVECAPQLRKATISWKWTKDNGEPITRYVIQANGGFMPDRWDTIYENISATSQSVYIPLRPWGNYKFRVLAANVIGVSQPSAPSVTECRVEEAVPGRNPRNVTVEGTEPNKLAITWTPLDQTELYGPGFYYEVSWKIRLANSSWQVRNVTNWNQSAFIVTADGVPPYREYSVKVVSFNEVGQSDEEVIVYTGFSHEGVPLMTPTNLALAENASATSATISWSAVTDDSVQGNFTGYKIEMGSKHYLDTVDLVPAYELSKTVNNLIPNTRYEVRAYACNARYCSLPSETLIFVTAEGAPDEVQDLQIERLGSTAFLLSWKRPKETHGVLTCYKVYCEKVRQHIREHVPHNFSRVVEPQRTRLKLTNLTAETTYRMILVAATRAGEGVPTSVEEQTGGALILPRLVKPGFRMEYAVSNSESLPGKAAISIQWLPCGQRPKCDARGTAATSFYVKYRKQNEATFERTSLQSDDDSQLIDNLEPFTRYHFKVVSVDEDGLEAESPVQSIYVVLADASKYVRGSYERTGLIALTVVVVLFSLFLMAFFMVSSCRIKRDTCGRYNVSPESRYLYNDSTPDATA